MCKYNAGLGLLAERHLKPAPAIGARARERRFQRMVRSQGLRVSWGSALCANGCSTCATEKGLAPCPTGMKPVGRIRKRERRSPSVRCSCRPAEVGLLLAGVS